MKSLLDRFRGKPGWQNADPAVRAEAVLNQTAIDDAVLRNLAEADPDARVRRAALKRLDDVGVIAALAEKDADAGVREEAVQKLVTVACHSGDLTHARAAVDGLTSPKSLATVARSATLPGARFAALGRISDPKLLATVVREAEDQAVRLEALSRIDDPPVLAGFASKSEVKAVALAALERVSSRADLETIAARARVGLVARRAAVRLEAFGAEAPALPAQRPAAADDGDLAAYEAKRAEMEREAGLRAAAIAEREALCSRVEVARGVEALAVAAEARATWASLAPLIGAEAEALDKRMAAALAGAEHEATTFETSLSVRGALEALLVEAEPLVETPDPAAARATLDDIRRRWNEARGTTAAPSDLGERLAEITSRLAERESSTRAERAQREKARLGELQALCSRGETLSKQESPTLRDADRTLREVREAIASPGHLPTRKDRDELIARLEAIRHSLQPLVAQLREDTEWKRFANVDVQEDLAQKVEALRERTDFDKVAVELRDFEARWKQAKEAPREQGEALWARFKAARDIVHGRCEEHFAREAALRKENLAKKEDLVRRAEALAESSDWKKTAEELKGLQNEWKALGPIPQAAAKSVWERFRKPCDQFFTRRDQNLATQRSEWQTNLGLKEGLCARAEALAEGTDWDAASTEIRNLQQEWRKIGAVSQKVSDAVWGRFRKACDLFFERYRRRDDLAAQAALAAREKLVEEAEGLSGDEGLAERTLALLASWKQAPAAPADRAAGLTERFSSAVTRILETNAAAFEGTDLDPAETLRKAEKLVARVEAALLTAGGEPQAPTTAADLAERLRDALATNTIAGREAVDDRWRQAGAEVDAAQAAWQKLGPLVGDAGREVAARFGAAVKTIEAKRPAPPREPASSGRREGRSRGEDRGDRGRRPPRGPRPPQPRP